MIKQETFTCIRGFKCHVLNRFRDGENTIVTYKWWGKVKKRWNYVSVEEWVLKYTVKDAKDD